MARGLNCPCTLAITRACACAGSASHALQWTGCGGTEERLRVPPTDRREGAPPAMLAFYVSAVVAVAVAVARARCLVVSSCLAICVRACRGVPDEQLDVGFGPQECRTPEVRLQTRNGRVRAVADDFIRNAFSL